MKILLEDISWTHACYAEKWCIKMYGRRDLKTGTLVNLTDGGDGVPGWGTFEIRSYIAKRRYLNISTDTINAHAHKMRIARTHQCMVISAKTRWKNKSNEQLEAFSKAISESAERRFSNLTAEQKSELSYKSKETMGPEARSLAAK